MRRYDRRRTPAREAAGAGRAAAQAVRRLVAQAGSRRAKASPGAQASRFFHGDTAVTAGDPR
ncbi:hypothetical protein [Thermaerobacter composti]|uniref:Uncharacterized protein n=1 Tax=Thermaerobacter composti TaxID=554949 RepID=A0ABZ0QR48_9FIRM|nr:hypothetical protein [Thermaerobacter composti]WPD19179.1 hypothetical protein Q5761_00420 [Thermaerobacter composti]